jgi:hypothetical protein
MILMSACPKIENKEACLLGSALKTDYACFPLLSHLLPRGIESLYPFVPYAFAHNHQPFFISM